MEYRIKEASVIAGVSVRTLHHYDEIGLLCPDKSDINGYRSYTDNDLQKLQQILFFRELDFSLSEIRKFLDDPDFDRKKALQAQYELLLGKKQRLNNIISSIEKTIKSTEDGIKMNNNEIFSPFSMKEIEEHKRKYASEVKAKYGKSETYRESMKKTAAYTEEDWSRITERGNSILSELAEITDGPADSEKAVRLVAMWQKHITESFYSCDDEILAGLGELYISDQRFTANIDKIKPGLAAFLSRAIKNYCGK